ncbi:DUF2512 family protein [Marinicrinis lubricantis]|uniref:DUF2512 family protein n=1 Tax=Marinicrinis lubricantis TaxID=2086470 RepID=A0ABW1IJS5_9BACL
MNKMLVKMLVNAVIIVPLLMYFGEVSFLTALVNAVVLSLIAYFVGDQMILRATNNTVATVSDGILSFLYLWIVSDFMDWDLTISEIVITSVILAVAEAFIHRYMASDGERTHA